MKQFFDLIESTFYRPTKLKPTSIKATGIEAEVCNDIAQRQQRGIQKYGTTVAENPLVLEQWLTHAYEEALDMAIYLKRAKQELKGKQNENQ